MLRRILHLEQNGRLSEVSVEISYPTGNGEEFGCRVFINGGMFHVDTTIFGVDELQAMTLAIRFARSVIVDSEAYKTGKLYWLEPGADLEPI